MSLKDRIARQKAAIAEKKTTDVDVVLDGEISQVTLQKVLPDDWDALVGPNPPRKGNESDAMVGYNSIAVSRAYPHVVVDGEAVDAETWADLFDAIDPIYRNSIGVAIWGLNINESLRMLSALGKARKGKAQASPEN